MTVTVYFDLISSMTSNEFMFKPVICSVIFFFLHGLLCGTYRTFHFQATSKIIQILGHSKESCETVHFL